MKNKIGFNVGFAILALPIGLALYKDTNFNDWTFRKPPLDIFYLIIFAALMIFVLKKQNKETNK
jgi:hypothetical protein